MGQTDVLQLSFMTDKTGMPSIVTLKQHEDQTAMNGISYHMRFNTGFVSNNQMTL